ncbi:hypothetical protein [Paraburkholderia sp. BL6669N2]|uniref:hypothetical protein n=1 Tax=Paraburkholderia sp. BL6669N2 TaxID=1938807 RepID=UPI0011C032DB|nr:hypothetical protein [Paraburkholderia sp. BL6669N2]
MNAREVFASRKTIHAMFRDALARHRIEAAPQFRLSSLIKRLLAGKLLAVQAPFFLTLAFLTIPPFWRHAGVGASDLA